MSLERDDKIEMLLQASSLGSPEVRALRDTVSREQAAIVLRRVEELEQMLPRHHRQPAYDAVWLLLGLHDHGMTAEQAALVWRAVEASLDAMAVPR